MTVDRALRQFFEGLGGAFDDVRTAAGAAWLDMFPATTRLLDEYEEQFAITPGERTEAQRRQVLAAAWRATGGQSRHYLEEVLQANGFDVYLHNWWDPADETPHALTDLTPRNPVAFVTPAFGGMGEDYMQMGEPAANQGEYTAETALRVYDIPLDPAQWHYIFYVGGATFGEAADLPAARREEFETLVLKHKPAHLWAAALINYI